MYVKARSLTLLGETGLAIDALEKAYQDRSFLTAFIKADPVFDSLRGSDRYQRILRQMELADQN